MTEHPNCKINIGLNVVAKRPDGYHNLESVFYPIPLCDDLEIEKSDTFSFVQDGNTLDCDLDNNLCVKAYRLLKSRFPELGNVRIRLTKHIPSGAGLGGGSTDAAFTLKMLNSLFHLGLTTQQLQSLASQLGADCTFFIENKTALVTQKGDVFQDSPLDLTGYRLLLVKPDVGVSTAEAYRNIVPAPAPFDLGRIAETPIAEWKSLVFNDFEKSVFEKLPVLAQIKKEMYVHGALYASMSGSGSTIYGIFAPDSDTSEIAERYSGQFFTAGFRL
ncbi:MAG: 4-(cytidine 5'-diphospho)-2-C-methyl-D-erythritol kinase [Bacteroidales bacterium]|nr:4-(cytidine 5'-diphospho)-2-C-methyl-D-erythritol kinase [Bacteroidales bacterium]